MRPEVRRLKKFVALAIAVTLTFGVALAALAYQACGWGEIREALIDGRGNEFIEPVDWTPSPGTELEQVLEAANYVADRLTWTPDPAACGDLWTSAGDIGITGDCEEFAILLCSLMRFSIGVPASRVWVQGGLITDPPGNYGGAGPVPPLFGHAYVVYKGARGVWYIEPQIGGLPYRGTLTTLYTQFRITPPFIWGESAQIKFNDRWVRGGGFWLSGPR
jgi:hypothetical protein